MQECTEGTQFVRFADGTFGHRTLEVLYGFFDAWLDSLRVLC